MLNVIKEVQKNPGTLGYYEKNKSKNKGKRKAQERQVIGKENILKNHRRKTSKLKKVVATKV